MIRRRTVLGGIGATLATLAFGGPWGLSRLAASAPGSPRFLFIFNYGGWDPTLTFATAYGSSNIDMEPDSELATAGGISWASRADRPNVDLYLERYHGRTLVINGMNVPSLAHEVCAALALTGSSNGESPDWGTLAAGAAQDQFTLPHLVLSGLTFPGNMGSTVARVGADAQLEKLLSGAILDGTDLPTGRPDALRERILDSWVSRRAAAAADARRVGVDRGLYQDLSASVDRSQELKDRRYDMDFSPGTGLDAQLRSAVDALGAGISRCVTLANGNGQWDTHSDNTPQIGLWDGLFRGLNVLMADLDATTGPTGQPLSADTVVVVLSEMGRTPKLNSSGGRDHWPYTSMMITGPGITGDRTIGAFDDYYYGVGVDRASGEIDTSAPVLVPEAVGAALLELAGEDAGALFPDVAPLKGMLA